MSALETLYTIAKHLAEYLLYLLIPFVLLISFWKRLRQWTWWHWHKSPFVLVPIFVLEVAIPSMVGVTETDLVVLLWFLELVITGFVLGLYGVSHKTRSSVVTVSLDARVSVEFSVSYIIPGLTGPADETPKDEIATNIIANELVSIYNFEISRPDQYNQAFISDTIDEVRKFLKTRCLDHAVYIIAIRPVRFPSGKRSTGAIDLGVILDD